MARRTRLDRELVRRGLVRSREQAGEAIVGGRVRVAGRPATKPATVVDDMTPIVIVAGDDPGYVSRGAHKLLAALSAFGGNAAGQQAAGDGGAGRLWVAGRRCLDAGASTGGFTDVLLRHDAAEVVAVDVGYGQLAWRLRTDPRVTVLERTNVRFLTAEAIGGPVDMVVADLSFISLRLVLPALRACARPAADFVVLVKPQFEVGRADLGPGGVVRDVALHARAVRDVAQAAAELSLGVRGVVASPLPGPAGNVEYLLWLVGNAPPMPPPRLTEAIAAAIAAGPAGGRAASAPDADLAPNTAPASNAAPVSGTGSVPTVDSVSTAYPGSDSEPSTERDEGRR
ncbi:TlyA family RNA methyltransferase [Protofrankia sp. BMG5.30]|uniref:TlyA family RNA methyltransferase n=1 Tax=Protofrankia sp. BMG5.30 TaxID=1834514 RepID=UPI00097887A5|nr:TlyA family RNA methyltransferase [Protofrankia sp. BMG5.30]ONH31153.1 hemolysin [Protofrankia sp. BMG5.30]